MAGFFKMHSDSSWRGAENYRVHTFKILGVLWGKMQTWYPCFIRKNERVNHQFQSMDKKKKEDSGGFRSALSVPLHSVQKKGFVWFRVLMRRDKGNQDMSRKQEQYVRETDPRSTGCLCMHLYTSLHNKRMYPHLYRGVGLYLFSHKEGTSFSIVNYILLASMHTWQVHKGSRQYMYTHTYSTYC